MKRLVSVAALLALTGLAGAGPTAAPPAMASTGTPYAPLDRPGPRLSVLQEKLTAAVTCHGSPTAKKQPVLLSPGTSVTP